MGGQSFKCPECEKWFLLRGALADHLRDKHNITKVQITGTGPLTKLESAQ